MPDNDTYEAAHTMIPLFRAIGSAAQGRVGRRSRSAARPSRASRRSGWSTATARVSMGFGLEAVNNAHGVLEPRSDHAGER